MENGDFSGRLSLGFGHIHDRLIQNFKRIYTSRVSADVVSEVPVEAYGSVMQLQELANLSLPEARTILIKPYDTSLVPEIAKAIRRAKPEVSPVVSGEVLRIVFLPPTEEGRKKSLKSAKELLEQAKVSLRALRKDVLDGIRSGDLPEDQEKRQVNRVDEEIKSMNQRLEECYLAKEKELMTI